MRRMLMFGGLVAMASLLPTDEGRAGSAAEDFFTNFTGPAFNVTVVLNADSAHTPTACGAAGAACPDNGMVAIRVQKGALQSNALFVSGKVANLQWGCDGTNGATAIPTPPLNPANPLQDLTERRFVGKPGWISGVAPALLSPFGITVNPSLPPALSDVSNPVCTLIDGVWYLSFTGTLQFGKK